MDLPHQHTRSRVWKVFALILGFTLTFIIFYTTELGTSFWPQLSRGDSLRIEFLSCFTEDSQGGGLTCMDEKMEALVYAFTPSAVSGDCFFLADLLQCYRALLFY